MAQDDPKAELEQAHQARNAGDIAAAEATCDRVLKHEPENAEALHLKAVIAYQSDKPDAALPLLEKATRLAPKNHHYLNTLGLVQRNLRQLDQALITFQIALTHKPDFAQALANMALVHLDKSDYKNAISCFEKAIPLLPDSPDLLTNYAHTLRDNGQTEDAAEVYHRTLALDPKNERYLLNVGAIEMALGNDDKALAAYEKVLTINPDEPTARHIVAGLRGETTPTAPDKYVADLFDIYADDFDHHLANLQYQVPQMLGARIPAIMAPKAKPGTWRVLDLGCGTGACGLQFSAHKEHLVGVDLSEGMFEKAAQHGVYDELFKGSITEYFNQTNETFDLIIAADVYVYIGDLSETFQMVDAHAAPGALYCFSTELAAEEEGEYSLRNTGRYAQSDSYIRKLAKGTGFKTLLAKDITVRKDQRGDIPGKLYILQNATKRVK